MSQYWIWSAEPESWEVLNQRKIWATNSKAVTKKVRPGDYIAFYVKGTGNFRDSYKVKSEWYETDELVWAEEKRDNTKYALYQCDLELHIQGYAVYSELAPQLDFVGNKSNPQVYTMGSQGGPANFQRPLSENDFQRIIHAFQEGPLSPPAKPDEEVGPDHQSLVSWILDIGTSLGFISSDSEEDTNIAKGAVLDAAWITRIANLGEIRYVFEVQMGGSIDSLLMNLLRASVNPTVRRLVVVSRPDKMDKIKGESETMPPEFKSKLLFWSIEEVRSLHDLVNKLNEHKQRLGIGL
jgi:predicted RNA-binding protein